MLVGNSGGARRDRLHCLTFEAKSPQVLSHLLLKFNGRYFSLAAPTCHQKHPYRVYSFLETTLTYYNRLGCKSHPWLPISCQTISGNTTTPVPQCNYSNVKSFTKTMFLSIFKFKKTTFPNSKSSSQLLQEQIPNFRCKPYPLLIFSFYHPQPFQALNIQTETHPIITAAMGNFHQRLSLSMRC